MEHDALLFFAALSPWKATVLIVLLPTAITMLGPVLVRRIFGLERLIVNNEIAGFKFAVVGVIYALLLTFAAISSWEKFSEAQVSVIEEAAAAKAIYQLTNGQEQDRLEVRGLLGRYLRLAIDKDWAEMEVEQESEEVSRALNELYAGIIQLIQRGSAVAAEQKPTQPSHKAAVAPAKNPTQNGVMAQALTIELIKQLDVIIKSRQTRVHLSSGIVPTMMWCVLIAGAVLTIAFTLFFGAQNLLAQTSMTGILAAMIFMSLLMIISFDHPFTGPVHVGPQALMDVLKTFAYD